MIEDYYDAILAYLLIGFVFLFIVIRGGLQNPLDRDEIRLNLGQIVLKSVIGWPYSIYCWICSWEIWFVPIEDAVIKAHIFKQDYIPAYLFLFAVLLFMNLMFVWYLKVF